MEIKKYIINFFSSSRLASLFYLGLILALSASLLIVFLNLHHDARVSKIAVIAPKIKIERTLSMIKPDAVNDNIIGKIYQKFEDAGLKIVAAKLVKLSSEDVKSFYKAHEGKIFYDPLVSFMVSGPIMVQVLEGPNAINLHREIMGNTDPFKADEGTIRALYGAGMPNNAVHGSDSSQSAKQEIAFFFSEREIIS